MTTTACLCDALTKDGRPCRAFAVAGSRFCFAHAPELAEKRKAARSAGGRARHGRSLMTSADGLTLASVADVVVVLEQTAKDLLALENSVSRARTLAYLCTVVMKGLELSDLEDRITALEEKVGV